MEEQLQAFLDFLQYEYKYSSNTTAAYRNDLGQFMSFLSRSYPGVTNWSDVTVAIVDSYVDSMKEQPYASSSVARKVAAVKSFFNHLFSRSVIHENPTTNIDSPKVKKRLPKTLSAEDIEKLLQAPKQKKPTPKQLRDMALLTMLYNTGMRVTEVVSLTLDDVDLVDDVLICQGKDETSRELPLDEETKETVVNYLENGRQYLVKNKDEAALFLNHRGQQLTRQGLWLIIKAYAKKAKLSGEVTPHTLRHSFAAHKLDGGSNLQEVQRLLGHANISTTQIYTQVKSEDEDDLEASPDFAPTDLHS
ncbi:MAG: tyrosine recombinase [Chloroflexi bacterium]|nr:tyrosine recombinase [Chloroflexota bacterium]